jgi:cytochrome c-type biogenesis protein CcmH/NrfF
MDRFLGAGMDREQVRAAFVAEAGSQNVLAAPIDEGFNRLAWLFPYLLGASGAVVAGFAVVRWSRNHDQTSDTTAASDPALDERLDDELRNLD